MWSGQSPQSLGHPSLTLVLYPRGVVPGLLKGKDLWYHSASELSNTRKSPCSGQVLCMKIRPSSSMMLASTTVKQRGHTLCVVSTVIGTSLLAVRAISPPSLNLTQFRTATHCSLSLIALKQ